MSKKVTQNVTNSNSEDLTELWKKDKINKGTYYCKSKLNGHHCIASFVSNKGLFDCDYNGTLHKDCWEVLAKVPSYEELQNQAFILKSRDSEITKLKTENKWYSEQLNEAVKEVAKLKELLTMVRDEIEYLRKHYKGRIDHLKNNTRLDKEIKQALGEE